MCMMRRGRGLGVAGGGWSVGFGGCECVCGSIVVIDIIFCLI